MSELMLDVGTANELKLALREARGSDGSEWTAGDVKSLANSEILGRVLDLVRGRVEVVVKSLLTLVKTITTPAIAGKKTANCFTNKSRYYYRDPDLDNWLLKDQPSQPEGKFSVQQLAQPATFKQAVGSFLVVSGNIQTLSGLLKERGCITTLPTIESLIERQESGEDVGLRIDGWGNFFFVENEDESVSVVHASRHGGQWFVYIYRLDDDIVWRADIRFFFRNQTL